MRRSALAAGILLCLAQGATGQSNPFFDTRVPAPATPPVALSAPRLQFLVDAQRVIREALSEAVDRSTSGRAGVAALVGLAFAYGLVHALGPGHRKIALGAYFVARPATPAQAVIAGLSVALLHGLAALAVVYGLSYLLGRAVSSGFASVSSIVEPISYAAIAVLGLVLLGLAVRDWVRAGGAKRPKPPARSSAEPERSLFAVVAISGLVPCPGTALVLIFCLSQGLPWLGVLAGVSVSLGMATVTVSVSVAAVLGRRGLQALLQGRSLTAELIYHGAATAGAVLVAAFGLLMLSPYIATFAQ
jgi:ABC-type nickel/cobalt efflux system permease component RcnA